METPNLSGEGDRNAEQRRVKGRILILKTFEGKKVW